MTNNNNNNITNHGSQGRRDGERSQRSPRGGRNSGRGRGKGPGQTTSPAEKGKPPPQPSDGNGNSKNPTGTKKKKSPVKKNTNSLFTIQNLLVFYDGDIKMELESLRAVLPELDNPMFDKESPISRYRNSTLKHVLKKQGYQTIVAPLYPKEALPHEDSYVVIKEMMTTIFSHRNVCWDQNANRYKYHVDLERQSSKDASSSTHQCP